MTQATPNPLPQADRDYVGVISHLVGLSKQRDCKKNRTDIPSIEDFGAMLSFDIRESFPLLQIKKTIFKSVAAELLGFLRGYDNVNQFKELGTGIWDEWQGPEGALGPIYGVQWRRWPKIGKYGSAVGFHDQLGSVIDRIKTNPSCRRLLVSAWNVDDLDRMALHPCHYAFQFHCEGDFLDLMWNQRSTDMFLGFPFNLASYATLLSIVAKMTGRVPRRVIFSGGNFHLYENQLEGANQVCNRFKRVISGDPQYKVSPKVELKIAERVATLDKIEKVELEDLVIENYRPLPRIKVEVAV